MIDRDRVTERVSLATFRLELKRAGRPLVVLLIGFLVAIAAGEYILNGINGGIGGTHTMKFEVADATGVVPGRGEVRFYGIQAGLIGNEQLEHGHAVLTVTVASKYGSVYRNAQAEIRPNTALQDMYLDITNRGTKNAGVAGPNNVIPISQTHSPTNLADVLDLFQPDVRTQLNNILTQLGNGLADRGADLRQSFIELAPFVSIAGNVSRQLAVRADLTKKLVHNAAILSGTLASRSTELHGLITHGTETLTALSTRNGAPLKATIAQLPKTLSVLNTFENDVDALTPVPAYAALESLEPVVKELPSALADLKALGLRADPAVRRLETPVVKLVPLARQLRPLAADLATSLTRIAPQVPDLNTALGDLSDCTDELNEFINWDDSMAKFYDAQGPMVRGNGNFGFYTVPGLKDNEFTSRKQCAPGTSPLGAAPTPKFAGPAPAP